MIRFADNGEPVSYPFIDKTDEATAASLSAQVSGRVVEVVDESCMDRPDGYIGCEEDQQEVVRMAKAFEGHARR